MESSKKINTLLIEDDPDDQLLLSETLKESGLQFELQVAATLDAGVEKLSAGNVDVVLLDLSLPDSGGIETFMRIHAQAPLTPVVILTGMDDETIALEAVSQGAQDYLVKGTVNGKTLARVMRYAIERNKGQAELRNLSLVDDLTGLYNRRGFLTFAEQYLKLAQRKNKGLLLMFADLDNLKQINDTYGHHEGDLALIRTAKTLRETFRKSDIIGRIGGDEFPIMAMEADRHTADTLTSHLRDNLKKHNTQANSRYKLSISVGVAYFDPENDDASVEELMEKADSALYEQKRLKKSESGATPAR
jgi:two-component system cell cycle response regulator